jgi:four helix bundle protein
MNKFAKHFHLRSGIGRALHLQVPVGHFSELTCWKLARALQREVFRITAKPAFNQNRDLRDQLRDAAGSARRTIAEGFGRRTHRDLANFFATSLTSLNEVEDELGEAVDNGYVTDQEIAAALNLKKRAYVATSRFRNAVRNRPDPVWNRWPKRRTSRT